MERKKQLQGAQKVSAQATVDEAREIAMVLIRREAAALGGNVKAGLGRAARLYGVPHGTLWSLPYRAHSLKAIPGHVLDQLRSADEWLKTRAAAERRILDETAQLLERRGSRCAGLARAAASLAGETED